MKKKWFIALCVILVAALVLTACVDGSESTDGSGSTNELKKITGVTFGDVTANYDGKEHVVEISGMLPEGATVTDTNNKGTEEGVYKATAKIECDGYETLTLTATLTIVGKDELKKITGVTFGDVTVNYDGKEHAVEISGTLPEGATVTYTNNKGTEEGVYKATAKIECEGYETLTLTATLTIIGKDPSLPDIEGVELKDASFVYDGTEKSLAVTGTLPQGATVVYEGNGRTDAGVYNVTATVECDGYNTLVLTAKLTVNKANFAAGSITFTGASFEYDAKAHKITVTGNIPAGATVTYSGGEDGSNGATSPGEYTITAAISSKNYNTLTLQAVLRITSDEEYLAVLGTSNAVYFQNSLDNNRLYAYDFSQGALSRVNYDKATYMIKAGGEIFYVSESVLSNSISIFDGNGADCVLDVDATEITTDGNFIYYNVNSLFNSENTGIYRISVADLKASNTDATATKLTSVKSEYITYAEGRIYFSNKSDGGKLYSVSASGSGQTPVKLYDYKVSDIVADDGKLYFTRHFTLSNMSAGAAIYSIDVAGGQSAEVTDENGKVVKITMSKGKYLTVQDGYVYFVNTDMVTTKISGDGIYRAKADGSGWVGDTWELLTGASKVVDAGDDEVFSLSSSNGNLYYFRTGDRHLYEYDLEKESERDLMNGFIPPATTEVITTYYEKAEEKDGAVYFINMKDGGRLYKYDTLTGAEYRVTGLPVADFAFDGDYIYYATTKMYVNFDLYRMSLVNGEPERISTEKCMHMSFDGDYIYYANFSGSNTLNRMKKDGSEDTVIFEAESVDDYKTTIAGGYLYFVADGYMYRYDLENGGEATVLSEDFKPNEYLISGDKIYMMNDGWTNTVEVYDLSEGTLTEIASLGMTDDARGMFVYDGCLYYYRNVAAGSGSKGLYKVSLSAAEPEAVLVDAFDGHYLTNCTVVGDKVYFTDVWQIKDSVPTTASSGKLCVLDMDTLTVSELN